MTRSTLISRSLRFYWRTHLGVVAGAAVASAVLVGALVVGDSVRHSLRTFALLRLGDVEYAVAPYDRFFRDSRVASPFSGAFKRLRAPVLRLRGLAVNDESAARANRVAVLGVDVRFWRLGGSDDLLAGGGDDAVVLNQRLARHLGIDVGGTVLIRVDKPSALPRDAPLSTDADAAVAFRLTVGAIATDAQLGRFSLQANQIPPFNAFVPLRWLQEKVGLKGRCNVLLVGSGRDTGAVPWDWGLPDMELELHDVWGPPYVELELRDLPTQKALELRAERIFLDPSVAEAALKVSPRAYGVLTYFVNELRAGERATPYSVVAAVGEGGPPELAPAGMADDEILINQWLAKDLAAKPGDIVELTCHGVGAMRKPTQKTSRFRFRVRAVLPIEGAAADHELMPDLPGVADSESLRDWEPGVPIDLDRIRPRDEDYWDKHRGTPKAFVTLAAGQRMWANRFSSLTAVRYPASAGTRDEVAAAIRERLEPVSVGLELRTERIFLDPPAAEAALKASPKAYGVLTYFVNELRVGDHATPYSIVAAVGEGGPPELAPAGMGDDEILINTWLANDLAAKPGDTVALTYYVVGAMRKLTEKTSRFRVRAVLPIEGAAADRELMPEFPGVADSENCRDWEPGIPIDLDRIRDTDEDYWDDHGGTPKAFITLAAGQRLWANRFGNLTAVRYPASAGTRDEVEAAILEGIDPASVGLFPRPVRAEALAASGQALDFGQLFIGLSFFLIVAALLLTGLLFAFGVEQRSEEVGTLLAVGYRPSVVRRLLLAEGGLLAVVGGAIGTVCGALYTLVVLRALATVWSGAVAGTPALYFHASPATLAIGGASSVVVALGAVWLVLRRQARRPARELLAGSGADAPTLRRGGIALWIGLAAVLGAVAIVAWAGASQDRRAAGAFFGAGGLLLVGGLCLSHAFLTRLGGSTARLSLAGLGRRNCARRRGRSLAVIGLLACGTFLVVAVGANRRDPGSEVMRRDSGTGGFAFLGETALPVFGDLNTEAGRDAFNLDSDEMEGVGVVALRIREGDDASCLNLNRAQAPRLLGVRSQDLASRGAFAFARTLGAEAGESPWLLLDRAPDDATVPCIGDEATVVWGLGRGLGDTIPYTDERGRSFELRLVGVLANSVLQGSLLVSEPSFEARFPSEDGYRLFLMDAPPERREEAAGTLSRAMEDVGLELTPTATRLAELGAVQNTYLSIFQALGGLGLLLGSVGLGVVVLRNVLERRSELALLRAVGYPKAALRWLVLAEHWGLVVLGLGCGVVAALVAVVPALRSPGATMPYVSLPLTLLAVVVSAVGWTWLAAAWALRSPLLSALRNE